MLSHWESIKETQIIAIWINNYFFLTLTEACYNELKARTN